MPVPAMAGRLVARSVEWETLWSAVERAAAGQSATVVVAGEAGVGKSRLVEELARTAEDQGIRVLVGRCVDIGDGELPYAPIAGALRGLLAEPVRGGRRSGLRAGPGRARAAGAGARRDRRRCARSGGGVRQGAPVRARAPNLGPARRARAGAARRRGPALGRRLDPRPAALSRAQRRARAARARADVPDRRPRARPSAAPVSRRARAGPPRHPHHAGAVHARRVRRSRGDAAPGAAAGGRARPALRALGGQRVLHRGVARGRRGDRLRAAAGFAGRGAARAARAAARPRAARRARGGGRGPARRSGAGGAGGRARRRRAGRRAARGGRRGGAGAVRAGRRLRVPARAAARGGVRRGASGRAGAAACGAGPRPRGASRAGRGRDGGRGRARASLAGRRAARGGAGRLRAGRARGRALVRLSGGPASLSAGAGAGDGGQRRRSTAC